jgi:hypothetical protein
MASSFSDLGIELMATGENAGTWGDKTNTNLQIVEKAIAGYVEQAVTSGGTTALSITDGDTTESTSVARHAVIKLTGTITGNSIVTVPDSIEKVYIVTNGTSGAYTVQFKTASGTGITFGVSEKTTRLVYSDGTNLVDAGFGGALDIEGRELVLDADGDTTITADTDDQIDIKIAGADDFQFTANTFTAQSGSSIVVPDGGLTFGSTAITATAAELNKIDGGTSATSTTVADADRVVLNDNGTMVQVAVTDLAAYFDDEITAMPNLTSVGTLTTLTVDNVIVNGTTIGHTSDTDLITLADGVATVAGEVSMTTLDIGGTNVTSTAAELNILDGVTSTATELNLLDGKDATHLAVPGKFEGTDFTASILIGQTTTGTLNDAIRNVGIGGGGLTLSALTSGDNNIGIGFTALRNVTTGSSNIGIGGDALTTTSGGSHNIAIGLNTLRVVDSSGTENTSVGSQSGLLVTSGNVNTFLGNQSGNNVTSGSGNVIIGAVAADSATNDRQLKIAGHDGSSTTTWISGDSSGNLTFAADVTLGDDLHLDSDAAVLKFGDDGEVTLTHVADTGLALKHTATADDKPISLTLQTGETDIAANDVIGKIDFQAPDESTGTDAILVAAGIEAVSEGDFSSSSNATKLSFKTGASEAAAEKMSLSSAGVLTVSSTITADSKDVILGKIEGTNFTNSLLVGHATTGTLSSAEGNTGVGIGALDAITSGDSNVALGKNAATALTTGSQNVFIGSTAGEAATDMLGCIAIGDNALGDADPGNNNIAIGESAGKSITGVRNLCIGENAGDNITSGSGNVIIGSAVDPSSATGSRQLLIAGNDGSTTTTWISGNSDGDLTFAHDVILANDSFVQFGDAGENILGNGTDLTINSSNDLHLTATTDINIPANVGLTFGDDGEKIEGDGTDLTISTSNDITVDAANDIILDADGGDVFIKDGGTQFLSISRDGNFDVNFICNQDKAFEFNGNDGGAGVITALKLDIAACW